eukprot:4928090-Prorocentrum_lima.AAC.1
MFQDDYSRGNQKFRARLIPMEERSRSMQKRMATRLLVVYEKKLSDIEKTYAGPMQPWSQQNCP